MDEQKIDKILRNAKTSMEIEGFVINEELEEIGRKIVTGELNVTDYVANYIAQYKQKVAV
ncbi:MAG: hypothetical protein FWH33_03360 [Oscillospiraceae bacterium]|nr:hypothetical protein [Oscillospiraceae bacterium]